MEPHDQHNCVFSGGWVIDVESLEESISNGRLLWKRWLPGARRAERFSHVLYGLIIITAVLVAERPHVESAADALGLLFGTALVLLLAHT